MPVSPPLSLLRLGVLLSRKLLDDIAITAGAVLDAAVDAADGGCADLHLLHDLVVGAAAQQKLRCFQPLRHVGDLFHGAQILEKVVTLLPRFKAQ